MKAQVDAMGAGASPDYTGAVRLGALLACARGVSRALLGTIFALALLAVVVGALLGVL